jgi:hypothetical protein
VCVCVYVVHLIIGLTDKGVIKVIFGDDIRMDLCCHHVCVSLVVDPVEYKLAVVDKEESHVYLQEFPVVYDGWPFMVPLSGVWLGVDL